jgi:hypothetical protein
MERESRGEDREPPPDYSEVPSWVTAESSQLGEAALTLVLPPPIVVGMKLELKAVLPRGFSALRFRIATLGCCVSLLGCATTQNPVPHTEPPPLLFPMPESAPGNGVARWLPVEAEVVSWLKLRKYPWVVDGAGLAMADGLTSKWTRADDGALSVRVWVSRGFTATSIDLFFEARARDTLTKPSGTWPVVVGVAGHSDAGEPDVWQTASGNVLVSENPWTWAESGAPSELLISFTLTNCSRTPPSHVQGIVNLRKP